jgi:3-phosphoshikimate 1-carboxyvinyltransferase
MKGEIRVPGDKSISHRSLIFAALATGRSRIRGILESDDVNSTAGVLRRYGVNVPELAGDLNIDGVGLRGFRAPSADLDCGNSGTTARLMTGVAAALPFESRFTGDASLSKRPMKRLANVLWEMGARVRFEGADGLPMTVEGGYLVETKYVNESASAQIKSALLLAGLVGRVWVRVVEPRKSRDHTEIMLASLGARIQVDAEGTSIEPVDHIHPLDIQVPGDPSSAAFFAARAALLREGESELAGVCLNPTRLGFFEALRQMGTQVDYREESLAAGEKTGRITVKSSGLLRGLVIGRDQVPSLVDELPLLACVATAAEGETRVTGAGELRLKESDRLAVIVSNLRAIGADAEELDDGYVVRGRKGPLSGKVVTHGDHRIAMAFGILGSLPGNNIEVDDPACVSVSYPGFWKELAARQ